MPTMCLKRIFIADALMPWQSGMPLHLFGGFLLEPSGLPRICGDQAEMEEMEISLACSSWMNLWGNQTSHHPLFAIQIEDPWGFHGIPNVNTFSNSFN